MDFKFNTSSTQGVSSFASTTSTVGAGVGSQPVTGGIKFGSFGTSATSDGSVNIGASLPQTGFTFGSQKAESSSTSLPGTNASLLGSTAKPGFSFNAMGAPSTTVPAATSIAASASNSNTVSSLGASLSANTVSKPSVQCFPLVSSASTPANALGLSTSNIQSVSTSSVTAATSTNAVNAAAAPAPASSVTATLPGYPAANINKGSEMTYKELEDQINKWLVELEAQEKVFLEQATKVNAWDKILIDNGKQITDLNSEVERVKLEQQRLNHELDFIVSQQNELEEMLLPLEESVSKLPHVNYQQYTDVAREETYQIAESIDAQLKRMTEDLKEVVDHLNSSKRAQDLNDPMLQIAKILNAHMETLEWVDQNTALLQKKTDLIGRYAASTREEHERNFRLAYS